MAVDAGGENRGGRDDRSEDLVSLQWGYCVVDADGSPQAVTDNAGGTQMWLQCVIGAHVVRHGNTLCGQHQQQERKASVSTQDMWREFHCAGTDNTIKFKLQSYSGFDVNSTGWGRRSSCAWRLAVPQTDATLAHAAAT